MKKASLLAVLACAASLACWAAPAAAQFAKKEDAIKYRQSALTLVASHFGRMTPVVKGQVPYDPAQIKANVALLRTLATLPWAGFGPGTEGGQAKDDIWLDEEGFKQAQQKLQDSLAKLSAAADTGELDKLRAAFGDVGASCKACHDSYREKK